MKLEKYVDKSDKRRKTILITISAIVLISISFLLYKTFASFTESAEFPIMNGKVDYFGNSDIYFVFYKGEEEQLEEMPQKDNKENLVFDHGECDNGASIEWNESEWAPLVKGLNKVKTKCSLYFDEKKPTVFEYITELANTDPANLKIDDTSEANVRYIGSSPNNYIDIGDKDSDGKPILWQIIGIMNNITNLDNGGQKESLIKIIRAGSIGMYSWDTSPSSINAGRGVNEWSEADVMKLLNPTTVYSGTPTIGGSTYWNRSRAVCYIKENEGVTNCDFTSSGISEEAKNKIAKVKWNTGTIGETVDENKITAKYMYEAERSSHNGKEQCASGKTYCDDEVPRTTTWDGYIGLMYPSDFGYAVGGEVRDICLGKSMASYNSDSCNTNDWLKTLGPSFIWTITALPNSTKAIQIFAVAPYGTLLLTGEAYHNYEVYPVAYLKSSTKILPNSKPELEYGSQGNPFVVE